MSGRKIAKPILTSGNAPIVMPKPQPLPASQAIDVVRAEPDMSVQEVTLNIKANKNTIVTADDFWEFVTLTKWPSYKHSPYLVRGKFGELNKASQASFKKFFSEYANTLKSRIDDAGAYGVLERTLTDAERAALISHVIGLGEVMYESRRQSPFFIANDVAATATNDQYKDYYDCFNG